MLSYLPFVPILFGAADNSPAPKMYDPFGWQVSWQQSRDRGSVYLVTPAGIDIAADERVHEPSPGCMVLRFDGQRTQSNALLPPTWVRERARGDARLVRSNLTKSGVLLVIEELDGRRQTGRVSMIDPDSFDQVGSISMSSTIDGRVTDLAGYSSGSDKDDFSGLLICGYSRPDRVGTIWRYDAVHNELKVVSNAATTGCGISSVVILDACRGAECPEFAASSISFDCPNNHESEIFAAKPLAKQPAWRVHGRPTGLLDQLGTSLCGLWGKNAASSDGICAIAGEGPGLSGPRYALFLSRRDGHEVARYGDASREFDGAWVGSSMGDVDGDGHGDVAILINPNNKAEGHLRVVVVSGRDAKPLLTIERDVLGTGFSKSIAGGIDLDGDGYPDCVVGITDYEAGAGNLCVVSGKTGKLIRRFVQVADAPILTLK